MKAALRRLRTAGLALPWRAAEAIHAFRGRGTPVQFVVENVNWVIAPMGDRLKREIEALEPGVFSVTNQPNRLSHRVAHFGSQYMWTAWGPHLSRSNRFVVSFFHGKRADGPHVSRHIDEFLALEPRLSVAVTGATLIEQRLLDWGVPRAKVVRIPIGIDTVMFRPPTPDQRRAARRRFAIDDDAIVVGSFQKDGVGWGDGMIPKRIKGPDLFLAAIDQLRRHTPVVALLTGPARGFVKQGLERLGVPFVHSFVEAHADLVHCYHALDVYFCTSREEGGPMGLLESLASGVPVVSTRVGMAPDFVEDGVTGALIDGDNAERFAELAVGLVARFRADDGRLRERASVAVRPCDWSVVARQHFDAVYGPLLHDAL